MDKQKIRIITQALLIIWTLVIIVLLLKPHGFYRGVLFFKGEDILYHFGLFAVWSMILTTLFFNSSKPIRIILMIVMISGILFGGITEYAQQWIPSRFSQLDDFIADMVGIFTGIIAALILKKGVYRIEKKYES